MPFKQQYIFGFEGLAVRSLSFSHSVLVFPFIFFSFFIHFLVHFNLVHVFCKSSALLLTWPFFLQLNTTTNYFSNDDTSDMHHSSSQSINSLPNQRVQSSVQSDPIKHHIRGLEHSASVSSFGNAMFDPLSMAAMPGGQRSANMPPLPPPRRKKLNPNEVSIFIISFTHLP